MSGPCVPSAGRPESHAARRGTWPGQGGARGRYSEGIYQQRLEFGLMIMIMISTHSELLSLPQYSIFPAPLWNKFWLFPPGDRGQLGHWGPLLCSRLWGPGSLLSLLITSEPFLAQLWVVSSLCRYQWSPGPDHTPGMTLNTLDTTQTFQKRFSIRSLVIRADIWASHFSYSPIVSFLRYRSIVKTKTSTQTFHATLSSRRLQTAVVRLWPRTHPVDIGAFLLRLQE